MQCPRCQAENREGRRFCGECGLSFASTCPSCGFLNEGNEKFCGGCGKPLSPSALPTPAQRYGAPESYTPKHLAEKILTSKAALEGERKQVTVLFADLKGSMELLADRDPEEARKILDPILEHMMEAVHRYEGTVNQVMGDGIMALFGAPVAHEDHAVRACYAALSMQASAKRYGDEVRRSQGIEVQIRVGFNSGDVVVRAIGSDLHMDYTAVGQTTHLAARMEQLATPGSIRLTADTLRLAEGYVTVKPIGPVPVKGLPEPVEVYELIGASAVRSRLHAAATRGLTRFVGRNAEVDRLRLAIERAGAGHGQVVAVVGEPGVGKSRLFYEFTRSHHVHGWLLLESGSVSYGKATAYLPVIDLLRAYFQIETTDDPRRIREKVNGKLVTLDQALTPTSVAILALLDVPTEDPQWQALEPAVRRQRTFDAVRRLLLRESLVQPLILVFEDLHWIDSETETFLDGVIQSLPTARILLLVNYRPEYQHGWSSRTYYQQLRIDPLPPESADDLLAGLLGPDPSLDGLKRLLIERTEGNPLFLEESVRTLLETRALTGEPGAYRLASDAQLIQVPATVQSILAARVDRLPPEQKYLLETAAVIGKDFSFALLQAIADQDEETLRHGLSHLQRAEFLYETRLFPDLEYSFKHALTHEVAYGRLLQERRRALHARVVQAIEATDAARLNEHVEQLAHHALRARLDEKAVRYLRQAGAKAVARPANQEAVNFFEQALEVLQRLPEAPERLAEAVDIRVALGPPLIGIKGAAAPEVVTSYRQAQELCRRLDDQSRLFPVLWGLWYANAMGGQYSVARELGERLLEVAERGEDSGLLLEAHHALWAVLSAMGEPSHALPHLERGLALYDRDLHSAQTSLYGGHDPGACCRYHLALTYWLLGYPDQAIAASRDALRLAEVLGHPMTTAITLSFVAWVHHLRGDYDAAILHAERLVNLGQAHSFSRLGDDGSVIVACARAAAYDDGAGLPAVYRKLMTTDNARSRFRHVLNCCLLAESYAKAGDAAVGLRVLESIAKDDRKAIYASEIHRIRGQLFLSQPTPAPREAEQCFTRAIELARRRQERSPELRAATSLATLLVERGQRMEAKQHLAPVYGWFREGFDTRDLKTARTLLNQLG